MAQPITFGRSLQRLQFIFRLSGLTFESKKLTQKKKLKTRCVYLFNFFWLNVDVIGAICWFIVGVQTGKTFVELTYIAPCITFSFLANLKTIYLIRYEDFVCDLIANIKQLETKDLGTHNFNEPEINKKTKGKYTQGRELDIIKGYARFFFQTIDVRRVVKDKIRSQHIRFLHSVLKCSNILSVLLILTFIISPLILIALKYYQTKEVDLILPFLIIYPFDSHDIRYWPFVYLHQFWSVSIVLLNITGPDNLLYICCTYLGVQFRLLHYDIEHLMEKNHVLSEHELDELHEKCFCLIKWHQELIRSAKALEFIYAESTLFNFLSSSILICLTGFNVIAIENIAFAVTFLVFLATSLLQIYMLCYFGDLLMNSSTQVSDAVYNSKWYYVSEKAGKILLSVQRRAQKPCKLTAYGFTDVNLRAFKNILSNAWSYFALLKTIYTPRNN